MKANIGDAFAYASWQMSLGRVLYRDILGQQMPLLYLIGAASYRLWPSPDAVGVAALTIRLGTILLVFALARRVGLARPAALAAATIYLLLPMGFLFDARFDANALLTFWSVAATLALTRATHRTAVAAGICCACAVLSKLTGIAIGVSLAGYLLIAHRRLVLPFASSLITMVMAATAIGYWIAGPGFIAGAYLAHAHDPRAWWSVMTALTYLWRVDGATLLLALITLLIMWPWRVPGTGLLAASFLGGAGALAATITIRSAATNALAAEPAASILVARAAAEAASRWRARSGANGRSEAVQRMAALALLGVIVLMQIQALRADQAALAPNNALADDSCLAQAVRAQTAPRSLTLLPPYVALLAQRTQAEGIADSFNWTIRTRTGDAVARAQLQEILGLLHHGKIAAVMVDWAHPLPPAALAQLRQHYIRKSVCGTSYLYVPR
jgi:hypothetical protein